MLLHSLIVALCVFSGESVVQNVSCPVISPRDLDLNELDGKWYITAVATDMEIEGDCAMVVFNHTNDNLTDVSIMWINNDTASYYTGTVALTVDPNSNSSTDGDLLSVTFSGCRKLDFVHIYRWESLVQDYRWESLVQDSSGWVLPTHLFLPLSTSSNATIVVFWFEDEKMETFWFLEVDYEHYALMFACNDNDDGNSSTYKIWELTRAPHAKPKHASKIYNALAEYELENTTFSSFNNTEETCRYNGGSLFNPSFLIMTPAAALAILRRLS